MQLKLLKFTEEWVTLNFVAARFNNKVNRTRNQPFLPHSGNKDLLKPVVSLIWFHGCEFSAKDPKYPASSRSISSSDVKTHKADILKPM